MGRSTGRTMGRSTGRSTGRSMGHQPLAESRLGRLRSGRHGPSRGRHDEQANLRERIPGHEISYLEDPARVIGGHPRVQGE